MEKGSVADKKTTLLWGRGLDEKILGEGFLRDSLKGESVSTLLALIEATGEEPIKEAEPRLNQQTHPTYKTEAKDPALAKIAEGAMCNAQIC